MQALEGLCFFCEVSVHLVPKANIDSAVPQPTDAHIDFAVIDPLQFSSSMALPSRLPCIRRNAKRPISIRPLHPFAEIDALSSGVFHFNESGTFRAWRAVEDDIDVIHWATSHYYYPRSMVRRRQT